MAAASSESDEDSCSASNAASDSADQVHDGYTPSTPFVVSLLQPSDEKKGVYEPMELPDNQRHAAKFAMPNGIDCTVEALSQLYLSEGFMDRMKTFTNQYAKQRLSANQYKEVELSELYHFLAILFYMGLVELPAKTDFWATGPVWPSHPVIQGMSLKRFQYIWRNVYFVKPEEKKDEDGEGSDEEHECNDDEYDDDERWFRKAAPALDQMVKVSQVLCKWPSYATAVDEQMKKFKGRSGETWRMKGKPVKEGFKFFAICCSQTGFAYNVKPAGRLQKEKVIETTVSLVESLPQRDTKKYVCAMDNYFTYSRTMLGCRELGVAVVGTAKAKKGWPPKRFKDIKDKRFNTLYYLHDKDNYLIARWVDNSIVTMVSTMHDPTDKVLKARKKPRKTKTNKQHLQTVWGQQAVVDVFIPLFIDDYNHWMLGVDKNDQLVAYYRINLRCRRTWMPIMLHALDLMRTNAFIVFNSLNGGDCVHKDFVEQWVHTLLGRAAAAKFQHTRAAHAAARLDGPPGLKKRRMSSKNPTLPAERLNCSKETRKEVVVKAQRKCKYCSYLKLKAKNDGQEDSVKVKSVTRTCSECFEHLCKEHFNVYHDQHDE